MRTAERSMELGMIAPRVASGQQVAASVKTGFLTFLRRITNRMAANRLMDLDDHQLADIGLTRHDVRTALGVRLVDDPTTQLAHCAKMAAAKAL